MKTIILAIALLCVPAFAGAQSMQAYVDSLGDQPGASPCSKLMTMISRTHQAKEKGVADADIRHQVLKDDPQADEALGVFTEGGDWRVKEYFAVQNCERKESQKNAYKEQK